MWLLNAGQETRTMRQVNWNLEREYRDCIKSRRDKIRITRHIMMHQVLYIVHVAQLQRVTCTLYSTWCIMICLVILILSLLLLIQSLYSLSKLHLLVSCLFLLLLVITLDIEHLNIGTSKHQKWRVNETIILPRSKIYSTSLFHCMCFNQHLYW